MFKITKTKFIGSMVTILMAVVMPVSAVADSLTMNFGFAAPTNSIYGQYGKKLKQYVEEYTNGTVKVKLHPSASISTEDQAFKAMQLGTVDAYIITSNNVSPHWPLMDVTVLPYIFQSNEHMIKVMNGSVTKYMKQKIYQDTRVHMLSIGPIVWRDFFNSKRPIYSIEDMKGLKIRIPKNKVMIATFEAFGANPIPLAWSETPTALQTRTVDGGDNGVTFIKDLKFYEHQKHLSRLYHIGAFLSILASDRFVNKLSPQQKQQVERAADQATKDVQDNLVAQANETIVWLSTKGGMQYTEPDLSGFIKAGKMVQNRIANERGGKFKELVKKIQDAAE